MKGYHFYQNRKVSRIVLEYEFIFTKKSMNFFFSISKGRMVFDKSKVNENLQNVIFPLLSLTYFLISAVIEPCYESKNVNGNISLAGWC